MTNKKASHRQDPHYKKAKKEGYRARAAYKLLDIQARYNVFKRAFYILDLGCAPGSWLQVSKKLAEENLIKYNDNYYHRNEYKILGVDIKKTSPLENISTIQMDFTQPDFRDKIGLFFQDKLDLILSDASINKIGNKFADHINQINLCFKIFDIVQIYLKIKGVLVMKTFQGSDFDKLIRKVKSKFRILKTYKPSSSKKTSNEIYLIGIQKM